MGRPALLPLLAGLLLPLSAAAGDWAWSLPDYIPPPRVPADNPMTTEKVELGRHLFYDRRLSGNGTTACSSCHLQALAFTDGRAVSPGSTGAHTHRNAPTVVNSAWNATYTWANPALVSLESQMENPLFGDDPVEMGVTDHTRPLILDRLKAEPVYAPLFSAAFPDDPQPVTLHRVIQAISSFQRALVSADSRYDRSLQGRLELTPAEQRGRDLFFGERAECHHCHGSFNFNDQVAHARSREVETPFHNTGLYNIGGTGAYPFPNRGIFELSGRQEDMGAFRAPSLRNIALTAPYMHDGSVATLAAVVDIYSDGGRKLETGPLAGDGRTTPHKSGLIARIDLSATEKADLVAFLESLTDLTLPTDPRFADPWSR
ncbi:methanobactin export MATE transporter MbnM [Novispirillum itersonii]|uniref:methanobactin export MATE transporter MbnM n=1 Tax=Novispirillum itersonii TaxID=189 RepID=UPI00036B3C4C|nr:methanobactin export MATE transporter MbnM [Novispirillum itersonii]